MQNRVDGANKTSYGKNRKEEVLPAYQHIINKLQGVSYAEAESFMISFLEELYRDKEKYIQITLSSAHQLFEETFQIACKALEKMTEQPLYKNDFTIFLTTFPRGPYNKDEGQVWIPLFQPVSTYLGNFLHELQHFQVIHYYKSTLMKELSEEEFQYLKEALTVILNDECLEFLGKLDIGYPFHQVIRRDLLWYRRKVHHFQSLLTYGCEQVKKQRKKD
ncbi:MAG: hypothetical protein LBP53_01455 [Candidatus Peribacteria bacterium]|nr:hypothetical protein [Candidatus Peribacteria bacterium]